MSYLLQQQLTKPGSGGLLLLRRRTPLPRRTVTYFCSGAYRCARRLWFVPTGIWRHTSGRERFGGNDAEGTSDWKVSTLGVAAMTAAGLWKSARCFWCYLN